MVKKLIIPLFLISIQATAYTFNNSNSAAFSSNEVKVNIASNVSCDNIGMTHDEVLTYVVEGVNKFWNRVPTSRLKLVRGSQVSVSDANAFKTEELCTNSTGSCTINSNLNVANDILIACNQNATTFSSSGILAVTLPINISNRTINGSVILLNDRSISGVNLLSSMDKSEFAGVLAHEIGHAVGLGHSPVKDSLMYYESYNTRHSLGQDDMDGISHLYPREQPVSCGAILPASSSNDGPGPGLKKGLLALLMATLIFSFTKKSQKGSSFQS